MALDSQSTAELADQVTTGTEADSCTHRIGCVATELVERDLNSLSILLGHSAAHVIYLDLIHDAHLDVLTFILHPIRMFLQVLDFQNNSYLILRIAVSNCVRNEVDQDLDDLSRVTVDRREAGPVSLWDLSCNQCDLLLQCRRFNDVENKLDLIEEVEDSLI